MTPPSSRSISPLSPQEDSRPHNKSVMFAPLSPTSSRRLDRIHAAKSDPTPPTSARTYLPPNDYADDMVYDDPSRDDPERERRQHHHHHSRDRDSDDEGIGRKRRRRRRRNSDPSSDRPNQPSKHRRRNKNASRSPSPAPSSDIEELPPRFDKQGRPLDGTRSAGGGQGEMVEKIMHDFGDVVDGRKSWKDMLGGLMQGGGLGAALGGGGSSSDVRDSGRRRRQD
jgi:hypothetical protein